MHYISPGLISLVVLALIHLYANQAKVLGWLWHGRFLSFASGLSFAYVFVDLLPALEKGQPALKRLFGETIPYFDRHTYLIALIGVLFYYGIHTRFRAQTKSSFWVTLVGYTLFNFLVGASLSDSSNPEIQPIILFTIAIGGHYFVRDHFAGADHAQLFERQGRWWLVLALFAGYFIGRLTHIPDPVSAILMSFLAGGIILNALGYELPKREESGYIFFVIGALLYTAILIGVGES